MYISYDHLMDLILEELNNYLYESLCHDKDTGHFAKCVAGNVYSLSDKGAKSLGIDKEKFVKRGILTKDKEDNRSPDGLKSPFGLNTSNNKQGGRIRMDRGSDISPKYSVSKYPQKYSVNRKKIIREIETALQGWLSQQGDYEDINESNGSCVDERRESYQLGIKAALNFIRNYESSKKGD